MTPESNRSHLDFSNVEKLTYNKNNLLFLDREWLMKNWWNKYATVQSMKGFFFPPQEDFS